MLASLYPFKKKVHKNVNIMNQFLKVALKAFYDRDQVSWDEKT